MLDAQERRTRLEEMLGLVQKNRTHLTEERLRPAVASPTPVAKAAPVAEPTPLQETVSMRKPDKPKAVAKKAKAAAEKPKPIAVKPKAVAVEPPDLEEVRQFESAPTTTTGAVAVAMGQIKREWTLAAVLERAWKLGSTK